MAEMLIVVAIIAVLVAVSIPIFTSRLEKAREATDIANMRAARAAAVAAILGEEKIGSEDLSADIREKTFLFYDADEGILKDTSEGKKIQPYGKGTEINAKSSYGEYDPGKSYDGKIICIWIEIDKKIQSIYWIPSSLIGSGS